MGGGGSSVRISDPVRPQSSSVQASTLPAGVLPAFHQGSRLDPGASTSSRQGGSRTSPSVSGFLQPSVPRAESLGAVAPHHRPVDPERVHHQVSLLHGDSTISASFRPSERLDDFYRPTGCLSASSCSPRLPSFPSIRGSGQGVSVQGSVFRSDDRTPGFHEDHGSSRCHSSQVRDKDASLPGGLAHSGLIQTSLFKSEGQAPTSMYRTRHPARSISRNRL